MGKPDDSSGLIDRQVDLHFKYISSIYACLRFHSNRVEGAGSELIRLSLLGDTVHTTRIFNLSRVWWQKSLHGPASRWRWPLLFTLTSSCHIRE